MPDAAEPALLIVATRRGAEERECGAIVVARHDRRELAVLDPERRADVDRRRPGRPPAHGDVRMAVSALIALVHGAAGADSDRRVGLVLRARVRDLADGPSQPVVLGEDSGRLAATVGVRHVRGAVRRRLLVTVQAGALR